MNPSEPTPPPAQSPAIQSAPPALPEPPPPLPETAGAAVIMESLLKRPAQLVSAIIAAKSARITLLLACIAVAALAAYGLVAGTFSGGEQLLAAPLKISLGAVASALICLPSLFIFSCLTGADVTLRSLAGVLCAALTLAALLLIGFAPIAWVFSQSTDSLAFVGTLHLAFWGIAVVAGLRLFGILMDQSRAASRTHLNLWFVIFILVTLQMTTTLRPILGTAPTVLPQEKRFFLQHWGEVLSSEEQ